MALLQLQDIRKSYQTPKGRYLVLQGIDLAVERRRVRRYCGLLRIGEDNSAVADRWPHNSG